MATDVVSANGLPESRWVVAESDHWVVTLNTDQSLLGRLYLMLKRPEIDALAITPVEAVDLLETSRRVRAAMDALWDPDHYNYAFLMNKTRQVHFHIIPRYRQRREYAGGTFVDPEFGDHYGVGPARHISDGAYNQILAALRSRLGR